MPIVKQWYTHQTHYDTHYNSKSSSRVISVDAFTVAQLLNGKEQPFAFAEYDHQWSWKIDPVHLKRTCNNEKLAKI